MGAPGCPEWAFSTASMARVRRVLMLSVSSVSVVIGGSSSSGPCVGRTMPQEAPECRTKRAERAGWDGVSDRRPTLPAEIAAVPVRYQERSGWHVKAGALVQGVGVMGHLFVPAALVLWVGVAAVRALATPAPAPTPIRAVEVERATPRPAESSGKS